MIKITSQEFVKRYDALPESFREEFLSDENVNMLWTIGEAHHLSGERIQKIAGVVGYAVLGLIHLEDISKEIVVEAGVDKRLADELTREIKLKILNPIIPQLQQLYRYGSPSSPQAEIIRPAFAEASAGKPAPAESQPFILHEEQVYPPSAAGGGGERTRPRDETLVRPSFYEEVDTRYQTPDTSERPSAARLEIGGVEPLSREPRVGKTETEKIRVVHYSGPQTPVNPFGSEAQSISNQPLEADKQEIEFPKDIHPENIVDLKDLPK